MEKYYKYTYNGNELIGYNLNKSGYEFITSGLTLEECRQKAKLFFKSIKIKK